MVAVIRMGREFGHAKLEAAVGEALRSGLHGCGRDPPSADVRSVAARRPARPIEIGVLAAYERPLPTMIEYDQLLSTGMNGVQA